MQYSCGQVAGFVILLLGTAAVIVSVATHHWSQSFEGEWGIGTAQTRGLWEVCHTPNVGKLAKGETKCSNLFEIKVEDNTVDVRTRFEAWEVAVLALMSASGLLGLVSLLMSPCCCNRCGCCLFFWVLLAALCCASGVGVFAYYATQDKKAIVVKKSGAVEVDWDNLWNVDFSWSFWVAVGGGALQFVASIIFGIARARQHSYSQTI